MNNPLVSIIIPTFNRAHLIGETLDSVFGILKRKITDCYNPLMKSQFFSIFKNLDKL